MNAAVLLLIVLGALLLVAAATDIGRRIIPNRLNLAIALLAPLWWIATGAEAQTILLHLAVAAALLGVFGALFALGMMGGGDVKLIAVLGLWLPMPAMLRMLVWMALAGGLLTLGMLVWHRLCRSPGRLEIPYGVAIVAAALSVMTNDILTKPIA